MNVYLVRMIASSQVVGVFAADGEDGLATLIDECCNPLETEYLFEGGFYVSGATAAQWPARKVGYDDFAPDDERPLDGAVPTGGWWSAIQQGTWVPMTLTGFAPLDAVAN